MKRKISETKELKILYKILNVAAADLDLRRTLDEVIKIVADITASESIFIYLFDKEKKQLNLMASKVPHLKELGKIHLKTGEGVAGWVAKENKPVAIKKNAYKDPRFKSFDILPEDKYEALLSVPIIYKGSAIGVINAQHKKPHQYDTSIIDLMLAIAKQIGAVIEHARLYQETRQKAAQFDSLAKVSKTITSEKYLDEILNLIVVVTAEMLNSKICSIMLLDEKRNELSIKATQSLCEEYRKKPDIKVNNSLSGEVIKSRKPMSVYDVTKEQKYVYRDLAAKENLTSMLSVPMIVKEKAIGIINIYTKEPHWFSEAEIDVLQMVANQAAVAVENTKLMEEAIKAKEALETRKIVERAKGILMQLNNLTEDAAYRVIHKKSMDSSRSMKEIAESIILMLELKK